MDELWQRIKAARVEAGLTQSAVADACGTSRNAVSLWETEYPEKRTSPTFPRLRVLAELTGKPLEWFLTDDAAVREATALYQTGSMEAQFAAAISGMDTRQLEALVDAIAAAVSRASALRIAAILIEHTREDLLRDAEQ